MYNAGALAGIQVNGAGNTTGYLIGTNWGPVTNGALSMGDSTHRLLDIWLAGSIKNTITAGLYSSDTDGASAMAGKVDTSSAWANATAGLFDFKNNGVSQSYIDTTGQLRLQASHGVVNTANTKGFIVDYLGFAGTIYGSQGFGPDGNGTQPLGGASHLWSSIFATSIGGGANQHTIPTSVASTLAVLGIAQTFTKNQRVAIVDLGSISATNVDTDASLSSNFKTSLTGACTLTNPTNLVAGDVLVWNVTNATGTATLAYGNLFKWPGGTVPTLSTGASARDTITGYYNGTTIDAVITQAFA
jgi:hypothetical protein